MAIITGLILLALGISLLVVWWSPAFVATLQVMLVLTLLFWGIISVLVGYSEKKAAREYKEAISDSGNSKRKLRPNTSVRDTSDSSSPVDV
jgi:hypothetical protein